VRLGVLGAGAIGCYVGGKLAASGDDVVLVGRQRLRDEIAASGLVVTGMSGQSVTVPRERYRFETELATLRDREVVLCCVKSAQTAGAGDELAAVLEPGTTVVSMQNGVRNADILRERLPRQVVLGGIVGFNVVSRGGGVFRRATTGPLVVEQGARADELGAALEQAGFETQVARDIRGLQWTKLLMNLNNAVSALSDRPTQELIFTPEYRRILGALIAEALAVLKRAGVRPARMGALPPHVFPMVLRLPTALIRIVSRMQLAIDPEARSSMWEDLERRRPTEVDFLNGEIVRLADNCGAQAPLNRRVVELVHEVEKRGEGSPKLAAEALWRALSAGA
jgi:2-dehydropantoate 2-reductase